VSSSVIDAIGDPKSASASAGAPAPESAKAAPAVLTPRGSAAPVSVAAPSGEATAFPPDLANTPSVHKRRLAVKPFDYSTVRTWVNYWFKTDYNIGDGIRAMLVARMHQSKNITLLERTNIADVMKEQDFGSTNRVRQGTKAKIGNISGADCILYGDIVIFGRDDKAKHTGIASVLRGRGPLPGIGDRISAFDKEEKAVVGINLRLVDAETGEVIETAESRGESSRKSKDYAGALGVGGAGAAAGSTGMTSSNFEATIIGEATSNAVDKVVAFLEGKVPALPAKARSIEGRIANITPSGVYLTVGDNDGVLAGDRFEILQVPDELRDPATKEVIDVVATKVGELVVSTVRDKTSIGTYGGQPISQAYAALQSKGYAARLMSK
jgi:curli biogenesis system outer membrane secretion channel CsgG